MLSILQVGMKRFFIMSFQAVRSIFKDGLIARLLTVIPSGA
jgi:hypothetical protein